MSDMTDRHNALVRAYAPLAQPATWTATLQLLLNLALGIAWFTIIVTMLSLSAGLMITLIGVPLLVATVQIGRAIGAAERARVRMVWSERLPSFPRPIASGTWWQRSRRLIADGAGWRGVGYSFIALPWGIVTFTLTVVIWSVTLSLVSVPIVGAFVSETDTSGVYRFGRNYVLHGWGRVGYGGGACLLGLLLLIAAPRAIRGLARADRWIVRSVLSPDPNRALTQRVEELTVSRDASVEGAGIELRRIERDLHDGAQQRLVGLAMDLGLARERLASGADPERAAELVIRAHEESKLAISELRDLVRGIHPSVLTDRGLDAALSALVARSPVPIQLDVDLSRRPPAAIEAAAYFVVAESLANIAKHSHATRGSVRVTGGDRVLHIDISDDGVGGAVEHPGGGLSGLRDRIAAVEGRLRISSPAGGPTMLAVELPCGS
jgi:signal transduction histidine kinase